MRRIARPPGVRTGNHGVADRGGYVDESATSTSPRSSTRYAVLVAERMITSDSQHPLLVTEQGTDY